MNEGRLLTKHIDGLNGGYVGDKCRRRLTSYLPQLRALGLPQCSKHDAGNLSATRRIHLTPRTGLPSYVNDEALEFGEGRLAIPPMYAINAG